ncbi:Histone-lysine N-methyltransferase, H3 lysine-36 and H4 lysine-20 specific, partial [Stegodyphus mimosarum]
MGQVANKVCIGNKSDEDNETDHSYLYERELCFICKTPGGYLICCQRITCLKNYHLDCVGLTSHPEGNWICPLHICNYCYSEAYRFCSDCPVSYCRAHLPLGLKIRGKEFRCTNCRRPPQPCPSSEPSESLKSATTLMSQSSSAPSLNQYPGEKLTVNYEYDTLSPKEGSYCSANCSGLTGGNSVSKVTKQPSENKMDLVNEVPNGSNSEQKLEIYEPDANHCFICKKPGSLISCINVSCIRAYHLHCVGLTEAPKGSWECSRHFCSTCKREAYSYCSNCPVSYCQEHLPSGLQGKSFRCINCQNPQQLCPPSESLNSLAALVSQSSSAPFLKDHADGSLYEKGQ